MVIFLKLGGSLITDKTKPYCARPEVIYRVGKEIQAFLEKMPHSNLVIGHGSGSFGHEAAAKYGTRGGVNSSEEWLGFIEVWKAARALNSIVSEELARAGLPIISLSPSASLVSRGRDEVTWNIEPIRSAISRNLIPLIHGDVIFDTKIGGTIFSTEELFIHLAPHLPPSRILLAGIDEGVYSDYPNNAGIFSLIDSKNFNNVINQIQGSAATDVTGGMAAKVTAMARLCSEIDGLTVNILSGNINGNVTRALEGESLGTQIAG